MITFTYTPIGGGATVPLTLLDSDRYWPDRIDFQGQGEVQTSKPIRAANAIEFGRGNAEVSITFHATRQHATIGQALNYLKDITGGLGNSGTLTITYPGIGGASIKQAGSCLKSATGYNIGVRSYVAFGFVGPKCIAGP